EDAEPGHEHAGDLYSHAVVVHVLGGDLGLMDVEPEANQRVNELVLKMLVVLRAGAHVREEAAAPEIRHEPGIGRAGFGDSCQGDVLRESPGQIERPEQ